MKKLKLFFACLLMAVLSIGQVWATEETVSWTASTGALGSAISAVNGTAQGTISTGSFSWTYTRTLAILTSGKSDYISMSGSYMQCGSGNAGENVEFRTSNIPGTIKSVTVLAGSKDSRHTGTITVGGTDYNAGAISAWASSAGGNWVGTGSSSGEIVISISCNNKKSPIYIASITVVYEESTAGCTSEIAITKADDPANGTFVIDKNGTVCIDEGNATVNVTATPAEHYHLASVTSTVGTVGTISGNTCEITNIDEDTEIGVTFAEDTKYVVTWNVNGNEDTKTNVYAGEKPVFPATPAACDATSTTFIGWATAPWTGKLADLSEKTVYTSASAMPDVDAAVTYYAVFAKSSGSASELFSWAGGGKEALLAIEGIVSSSLDADYAASHSPYQIKWNGDGKYLIIPVSAQPGKLSVGFKMIGGATTSTVDVQESTATDGEFTNVETLTISGVSNDIVSLETTNAFKSTTRAIKLLYHKGSNVGLGPISIESAVSVSDYMTTCCTQYNVNIAAGIENGSVSADVAKACEGATVTLTFTPAGGYHLDSWSLNGTAQDVNENTFSMPAAAVTVSATFAHDDCANLAAPTLDEITKTYNSATIAWNEVADAEAYAVSVVNHATSASIFAGNVNALSKALADLEPETQYDYSIMAVGDGSVKCADGNGVLEGNFTTDALPTAHLTLIDPSGTHASSGDYAILTPFNLPTTAAACSKEFRGWDSDENCATAPTYAKGAEFTFANTTGVTLYAVYADELTPGTSSYVKTALADIASGSEVVVTELYSETIYAIGNDGGTSTGPAAVELAESATDVLNVGDNTNIFWVLTKDGANFSLTVKGGTDKLYCTDTNNGIRVGTNENNVFSISSDYIFNNATSRYLGYNHGSGGLFRCYTTINTNINGETLAFYKKVTSEGTYGNYSTTCAAAPEVIVDPEEINATAAAVVAGVIEAAYDNVDEENISVALFNDAACTEAFNGGWLTASINGDNNIAYAITENTSYNDARSAYIKLTAPASSTGVADVVVVIPVSQAKKAAVFASLQELVSADVNPNTNVTVSFSNVVIKEIYMYNSNRRGLVFNIQKDAEDIKIYFNADVPAAWTAGGKVSGTLTDCPWKIYSGAWQLAPASGWAWDNGDLTYTAPPAISSIEIRDDATNKTYIDGQAFNPAGLSVIAIYDNSDEEDVTAYATWTFDPEKLSAGDTEVEVTAEYNSESDTKTITGLTVNPIPDKTIAQFIAAEGTRCYLEGIVSNITNTTYGNFDLTDASGSIYVYGCLTSEGESAKFHTLGVSAGDKIKVIAEEYLLYQKAGDPDKDEAKNVVFVSKTSPVEITITSASTVEMGKTLNLTATTDPAAGAEHITYSIKSGSESKVSLSDAVLTGVELGEATIIASIPDGEGYIANSVEFTVEVIAAIVHGSITYEENGGSVVADVADATNLPDPLPTVTKDGSLFGGWWTTSTFEDGTEAVAGASLTGDVILYAKWNEIPYWATVYTSNVEFTGKNSYESGGSKVVIAEVQYDAQKVGASGNQGQVVVTVPAKTHTLHFHVFTWKNKSNVISISGVTNPSVATFDVIGDNGGGASSPYTIEGNPIDHYYAVTFDAVTEETEITFDYSSGGDKRFIMYGINQEGGVYPVLDHIVITGTASATEYEAGDVFSPVGLGVDAYYTLDDEPIEEPTHLDVDENWSGWSVSPATLTAETETVTVTATYEGKQANKSVDVSVSVPATPEILASPASINFGTVNQNADVAAQGISVTLKAVAAATVTLAGDGAAAFSIDKAALSELNSTINVTPVTTATGTFAATVTISDDADAADDVVINLSMTVEAVEDLSGTWTRVTSVAAGQKIIIAGTYNAKTMAMGKQNSNNRAAVLSTLDGDVLTPGEATKVFTLVSAGEGLFAIQASNGKYLNAAGTGSSNYLREADDFEAASAKWTITFDENGANIVATSTGNRNVIRYNSSSGSELFSCYAEGGQRAINIYSTSVAPEPPVVDYTEVRNGLTAGWYYTMCLDKAVTAVKAGSIWKVLSKAANGNDVILEEAELPLAAGRPYIFLAAASTLEVAYTGAAVGAPVNDAENNGLIGSFSQELIAQSENHYIIYENALYFVNSEAYVGAHRAYLDMTGVPAYSNEPQQGAPRRRVSMKVNGPKVPTGFENIDASETPMKLMIDGQIYILRGEKMYDTTGRLVK